MVVSHNQLNTQPQQKNEIEKRKGGENYRARWTARAQGDGYSQATNARRGGDAVRNKNRLRRRARNERVEKKQKGKRKELPAAAGQPQGRR